MSTAKQEFKRRTGRVRHDPDFFGTDDLATQIAAIMRLVQRDAHYRQLCLQLGQVLMCGSQELRTSVVTILEAFENIAGHTCQGILNDLSEEETSRYRKEGAA